MNDIEELIRFYQTFQLLFLFFTGKGGVVCRKQFVIKTKSIKGEQNFQKEDNESERIRTNYPMD